MVSVITLDDMKELVNRVGLSSFILELIEQLKHDFNHWADFSKSPRLVEHYPHGVMELMPTANDEFFAYKFVNGHPANPQQHLLTVTGLGMLADVKTGYPLMISEMTLLTAIRTAATSALAALYLAPSNTSSLSIIGTGTQSEFQVLAHHYALGIDTVYYYDIDPQAMIKFARNLTSYPITLQACASAEEAVALSDVVITATAAKKQAAIIKQAWIRPGMYINAIGGDCHHKTELDPEILKHTQVIVEYLPQTLIEGEIQNNPDAVYAELWEIIQKKKPARVHQDDVLIFDSVGFSLEDFSSLLLTYRLAEQHGIGTQLNLIPSKEIDPKDLFSLL